MNRKDFLKSASLSAGVLAVSPGALANSNKLNSLIKFDDSNQLEPKIIRVKEGKKQIVLGDHQTIKLNGKDTNGQFTLIEEYNDPGVEIPMHVHTNEDEVFHVLSGELQVKVGNEIKLLKAGDMAFCPRGIPHSWKVVGSEKAKVMLSIFPAGLEVMFHELSVLPEGPPDFEKITKICSKYNIQFV